MALFSKRSVLLCIVWQITFKSVQNLCMNKNVFTPFCPIQVKEATQCK